MLYCGGLLYNGYRVLEIMALRGTFRFLRERQTERESEKLTGDWRELLPNKQDVIESICSTHWVREIDNKFKNYKKFSSNDLNERYTGAEGR